MSVSGEVITEGENTIRRIHNEMKIVVTLCSEYNEKAAAIFVLCKCGLCERSREEKFQTW